MRHWFAVVRENDAYEDWGYGSYDPCEAMKMAYEVTEEWRDWGDHYIVAAIDEDAKFCDFEISFDDIIEFVERGTYSVETYRRLSEEEEDEKK